MTSPSLEPDAAFPEMSVIAAGFPDQQPIDEYTRYEPESREVFFSVPGAFGENSRGFRVPYENLMRMHSGLDRVKAHYENILTHVEDLANVKPPFNDEASKSFARKLSSLARGNPEGGQSLETTTKQMIKWVNDFQDALREAGQHYRKVDEENRMR